ncbi:hypothetical protein [Paenibacillus sp. L3-i20]|uniref:hypothetical protein n=1 Tax=Paenibacillus sp. L3-i20 TaxID=2905833 RepID=UPI001EE0DE02|nr:hypothetical protein [Paenibacillus sp. L3-i20]GKU75729.1 hypothetical protein L3i20_v201260 [Paenibacillus sp. L3-i20]
MNSVWELIIPVLIIASSCAYMAVKRGKSPLLWFGLGLCLNVIALAIIGGTPYSDGSRKDHWGGQKGSSVPLDKS